jgi:hypothetical protein
MNVFRVKLTLDDPVTVGNGAPVSNEMRSQDSIPATTLRGALFGELKLAGRSGEADAWFGPAGPRWSAAWPSDCIPAPLCYLQVKRDGRGLGGIHGAWNALSAVEPPEVENGKSLSWQRMGARWLRLHANALPHAAARTSMRIDTHAGLRYDTQVQRGSALFSRESFEQGKEFYFYVTQRPDGCDEISSIVLGKRRSIDGGARLEWSSVPEPAFHCNWGGELAGEDPAYIQLMSPAMLPGPNGGLLRGLNRVDFAHLSGTTAEQLDVAAFSRFEQVTGWSGPWKLPKEPATAVAAGSCWRIKATDPATRENLVAWLRGVEADGIGLRREEGFGWIAVNPPWLAGTLNAAIAPGGPYAVESPATPRPWPGFSKDSYAQVVALRKHAATAAQPHLGSDNASRASLSRALYQALTLIRQGYGRSGDHPNLDPSAIQRLFAARKLRSAAAGSVAAILVVGRSEIPEDLAKWAFYAEAILIELEAFQFRTKLQANGGGAA